MVLWITTTYRCLNSYRHYIWVMAEVTVNIIDLEQGNQL
ncbi:hypothetical protein DJ62_2734 [Yersinia enterocolitica]|nr:hypothetical protein DJ62_2734 [Yersinia enterocolitica]